MNSVSNLQETALNFIQKNCGNLAANDLKIELVIFDHVIQSESIWYSKDKNKIYLHVGCKEFEGDIDIDSLSDNNQAKILTALSSKTDVIQLDIREIDILEKIAKRSKMDAWFMINNNNVASRKDIHTLFEGATTWDLEKLTPDETYVIVNLLLKL